MPKVNWEDAKGFEPMPEGIYDARLAEWSLEQGPKGHYYNCTFELDGRNQKVWDIWSIAPGALWGFKENALALGASAEDLEPGSEVDTDDIMAGIAGEPCRLALTVVEYTKRDGSLGKRNEVKSILAAQLAF